MRPTTLIAASAIALILADSLAGQRGGRRRRAEEISNRVGAFFSETAGPATDGDKVADLNTIEMVRAAAGSGQVTVLYLHDGKARSDVVREFEGKLFRDGRSGDELGIKLRCFHCGSIDLAKEPELLTRFGEDAPLFIAFDKDGKQLKQVSMAGYKADTRALEGLLDKAAKGAFKPSLKSFAKKYGDFIRHLEAVLQKKTTAQRNHAKAGKDKRKRKKAEKEVFALQDEEKKLRDHEEKLLEKMRLPGRGSKRLGGAQEGRGRRG